MDGAKTKYLVIRSWWLSFGAATEEDILGLSEWLDFWHFHYKQWGGYIFVASASPLYFLQYAIIMNIHGI